MPSQAEHEGRSKLGVFGHTYDDFRTVGSHMLDGNAGNFGPGNFTVDAGEDFIIGFSTSPRFSGRP
jgi:hypothetical protein